MYKKKIWFENLHKHIGQYFEIKNILCQRITENKQELIIFQNEIFGKIMSLNNIVQTTEKDEFIYHEIMTHLPIIAHGNPKKILIIGGGDGGILREVLRYPTIEQITMVEIDFSIINCSKKYLPKHSNGAFNDCRLNLVIDNGLSFLCKNKDLFDIIISDCTDPVGPGIDLFTSEFYKNSARCLNKEGIFIAQNGVFFLQKNEMLDSYYKLNKYFNDVTFYQATIPTYYGGVMLFAWASQNKKIRFLSDKIINSRINKFNLTYKYYNKDIHFSSFFLPQYILNYLH